MALPCRISSVHGGHSEYVPAPAAQKLAQMSAHCSAVHQMSTVTVRRFPSAADTGEGQDGNATAAKYIFDES